jgi:hypothetical protein
MNRPADNARLEESAGADRFVGRLGLTHEQTPQDVPCGFHPLVSDG